uniref:Regulator of G protein signaling 18 n=1 Tax=Malurus cyaneus samueli TaxID=2593467 RepID=A0A8C5U3F1_9PASS
MCSCLPPFWRDTRVLQQQCWTLCASQICSLSSAHLHNCIAPTDEVYSGKKISSAEQQKDKAIYKGAETGLEAFTKFLKTEFSEENIEFWVACEDYKKSKSTHELLPKAKAIFETFIQKDAPKEVNLDFHTKEVTSQSMGQPLQSTFDAAQNTVYRLMEQDSYPRFLRSEPYLSLVKGRSPAPKAICGIFSYCKTHRNIVRYNAKLHESLPKTLHN